MRARPLPDPHRYRHFGDPVLLVHEGVIVADKPAGLPSTGRDLSDPDCLQALLMARLRRDRVWAVHQLDQETSGLNLFVLRKALVEACASLLHAPGAEKRYLALVHGRWEGGERRVDAPIGLRQVGRKRFPALDPGGRPARSRIHPLAVGEAFSLLEVVLETGRTHQARLHLASLGHPLVGEKLHRQPACTLLARHGLHAWKLDLPGAPDPLQHLLAPVPADLRDAIHRLGLRW